MLPDGTSDDLIATFVRAALSVANGVPFTVIGEVPLVQKKAHQEMPGGLNTNMELNPHVDCIK